LVLTPDESPGAFDRCLSLDPRPSPISLIPSAFTPQHGPSLTHHLSHLSHLSHLNHLSHLSHHLNHLNHLSHLSHLNHHLRNVTPVSFSDTSQSFEASTGSLAAELVLAGFITSKYSAVCFVRSPCSSPPPAVPSRQCDPCPWRDSVQLSQARLGVAWHAQMRWPL